jgi:hypothetical protein
MFKIPRNMCNMLVKSEMVNEVYTKCLRMMSQYSGYASVVRTQNLHLERLTDSKSAEVSPKHGHSKWKHDDTWGYMGCNGVCTSLSVFLDQLELRLGGLMTKTAVGQERSLRVKSPVFNGQFLRGCR